MYALNPEHSLLRFSEMYSLHPLDDAFTASMKAMLRKACQVRAIRLPSCTLPKASSSGIGPGVLGGVPAGTAHRLATWRCTAGWF